MDRDKWNSFHEELDSILNKYQDEVIVPALLGIIIAITHDGGMSKAGLIEFLTESINIHPLYGEITH